jgi:hypothetical protein
MRQIVINIACKKKRCGDCDFCRAGNRPVAGGRIYTCDIFKALLHMDEEGRPWRHEACLESGRP